MTKASKKTSAPVHSHLCFNLSSYSIRINGGINHEIFDSRYQLDETHIYNFTKHIEVTGECTYPEERSGDAYSISIYGQDEGLADFNSSLADFHVKNADGAPKYRKRGDRHIPIFDPPDTIGFIEKNRSECMWSAAVWLPPNITSDMLQLLAHPCDKYFFMHEVKTGKRRAVRNFCLQTTDPTEE